MKPTRHAPPWQRPRLIRPSALVVDSHCHAGKGDGLTGPWDTDANLERYLARASRAGIVRTVLLPAFNSNYREANRRIAAIAAAAPARFYCYAMVHPERDARQIQSIVREAVEGYGFCGIKVHRHDARITREICEVARSYSLPVLYDVMGETPVVELLAREYPDVNFIIPHLGSFADDWRAHVALIDLLVRYPNVYTDTAGVRRFDYLVEAIRRAGPAKMLFGTDGPWLHPALELIKIHLLGLRREDQELVLGRNVLRLISGVRQVPSAVPRIPTTLPPRPAASDPWLAQRN